MADCGCDTHQASAIKSYDEALAYLLAQASPITETEIVPLEQALDRVLAVAVQSQVDVPPWDNSAMDGYAVKASDLTQHNSLRVAQRIAAGSCGTDLQPGTAARIFTGAPVPPGADAVVIQEVCSVDGDSLTISETVKPGDNIRRAGEDILQGETILEKGTKLSPQQLGLAASVGVAELEVYRRLKVAILSSGDELVMPGGELGPGQIYNSNQFSLAGLLQRMGCEVIQLGMVEDTLEATCEALRRGAEAADLILASGGVSVGEEDHVKPAVERLGSLDMWKVAVRPGKPIAYGHVSGTPFLGAPGNPVSIFITFTMFSRPFILRMQGVEGDITPLSYRVNAGFDKAGTDPRCEYARARIVRDEQGRSVAKLYTNNSSGVLNSMAWADGFVVLPVMTEISPGDSIEFIPFSELMR